MADEQTEVTVYELPDCDIHKELYGTQKPAVYDAETNLPNKPWAYLCADCFPRFSPGRLGLGLGQRLVLASTEDGA